ncbi:MAG: twin-arginine translocase TatA/TatE family subunit [Riemerella sp.]|nr:twin-arginine translocase TatA/TatE family subunit [Riemerella sp.]
MNNIAHIPLFMGLGVKEILVIAVIILLLFGGKKIPELMKGIGSGIKEFKKSVKDDDTKDKEEDKNNTK